MHKLFNRILTLLGKKKLRKANYLIEFRFHGYAKRYARELSQTLSKEFHIRQVTRKGKPPHITLFGGFECSNEKNLIS